MRYFFSPSRIIVRSSRQGQLWNKQICLQSTVVSPKNKKDGSNDYPLLDTRFNQYRIAYRYRRSMELLRGYLVYRLFSINFLVNNQARVSENEEEEFWWKEDCRRLPNGVKGFSVLDYLKVLSK